MIKPKRIFLATTAVRCFVFVCVQVILVGDPKQLPPTLLSRSASTARLSQSLFSRLQLSGVPVHMLSTQYRMHPTISR